MYQKCIIKCISSQIKYNMPDSIRIKAGEEIKLMTMGLFADLFSAHLQELVHPPGCRGAPDRPDRLDSSRASSGLLKCLQYFLLVSGRAVSSGASLRVRLRAEYAQNDSAALYTKKKTMPWKISAMAWIGCTFRKMRDNTLLHYSPNILLSPPTEFLCHRQLSFRLRYQFEIPLCWQKTRTSSGKVTHV